MSTLALNRGLALRRIAAPAKEICFNLVLISLGSIIFVIGLNSILIPKGFMSGGLVGIAMIFHYLNPSVDVGPTYFLLNLPLILLGWLMISRKFMLYSIYGIVFFSFAALYQPPAILVKDPILSALLAGVICGVGGGIILRSIGSAGGLDILTVYCHRKFGFRMGTVIFFFNAFILLAGAMLFDLERALYSVIFYYASARVVEAVLTGFNRRKSILIISENSNAIAEKIMKTANRGVTFLKGEGAYTGEEKNVIFTVTSLTELPKIKELIYAIDSNAFVVVNETLEVIGKRHGRLKVY